MSASTCPFCEIVAGRSLANIVFEMAHTVVIKPLSEVVPGHVLAIPKEHVKNFMDDPETTASTMHDLATYAHSQPHDQFNVIVNQGSYATQSVWHLHVHFVPRRRNDGISLPWSRAKSATLTARQQ